MARVAEVGKLGLLCFSMVRERRSREGHGIFFF